MAECIGERAVCDAPGGLLTGEFPLEAVIELCAGLCIHHIPHLGLARFALHALGVGVVRMHLHRERPGRVDEFDEHGEHAVCMPCPHTCGVPGRIFRQRPAGVRPIDNGAGAVLVAAQLPAFGQGRQSGMLAVFAFQAFTAPQVVLERGRELFYIAVR